MPKFPTLPTLYDECKTVSIAFLKKHGYLAPDHFQSGTITWSRDSVKTSSIGISVYTCGDKPYLELNYKINDKAIKYKVLLLPMPSNIGKGVVWYFLCPNTGKRCRKLYMADTYFLHRSAFRGCFYEKQTFSHKNRVMSKKWGMLFSIDDIYAKLHNKHFKKQYKGKPTKRYLKLMNQLDKAENIDETALLKL